MDKIVFGPVPSRRLGQSLGINNIPPKICSYSCIYCQVGKTCDFSVERKTFYPPERIVDETGTIIRKLEKRNERIDFLTFVSDGEPTLDINIGKEIKALKLLGPRVAVITNSSLLWQKQVREELNGADLVSVKIDAVSSGVWKKINSPSTELDYKKILEGIKAFRSGFSGVFYTETILVGGVNDKESEVEAIALFISRLKPSKSYIGVPTRPPAEKWVVPAGPEILSRAYMLFREKGIETELITGGGGANSFGYTGDIEGDLLNIISVHPMSRGQVDEFLRKAGAEWTVFEELLRKGKAKEIEYRGEKYYLRNFLKR